MDLLKILFLSPHRKENLLRNDATGFTLCYGLLFCTCFSQAYLASIQSFTQKHWKLVASLTDDYLDQPFTGKLVTACRTHDFHPLERAHSAQTKRATTSKNVVTPQVPSYTSGVWEDLIYVVVLFPLNNFLG
jgi:hypothetical protein